MRKNNALKRKVWDGLLTTDLFNHMVSVTDEDGDNIEEPSGVLDFFDYLRDNVSYYKVLELAETWSGLSEIKQVSTASEMVNDFHLSRFMMMMDYVSTKVDALNKMKNLKYKKDVANAYKHILQNKKR